MGPQHQFMQRTNPRDTCLQERPSRSFLHVGSRFCTTEGTYSCTPLHQSENLACVEVMCNWMQPEMARQVLQTGGKLHMRCCATDGPAHPCNGMLALMYCTYFTFVSQHSATQRERWSKVICSRHAAGFLLMQPCLH